MSSLSNDIGKILTEQYTNKNKSFLLESWEPRAQLEKVHLYESKRALSVPNPSIQKIATAMVELAGTDGITNIERDSVEAIKTSAKMFRTNDHLHECWQTMGKLVEAAHSKHGVDLQEMIGSYNDNQLELLEVSLQLPWRLSYSEDTPVEVHDYPISQEHVFKGTEPEDPTQKEVENELEKESSRNESKLNKLKGRLTEARSSAPFQDSSTSRLVNDFVAKQGSADKALKKLASDFAKSKYFNVIQDYLKQNS